MKKFNPANIKGTKEYGGNVKIIVSDQIGSALNSGIFTLAPGEELVRDIHNNDEVFYIISGTLTVESPGQDTITANEGEMVLISAKEVHYSKNLGNVSTSIFWCHING